MSSRQDMLGLAETGSGKTVAFALPILQKLAEDPYGIFALVMTPTQELAFQISDQFKALGLAMSLRCVVAVGGMDMTTQAQALMNWPHVVIATPGRIKDHLINDEDMPGYFSKAKFLVLDEADRLLEAGFEGELRTVLQSLPAKRQTLLFSATMTGKVAREGMQNWESKGSDGTLSDGEKEPLSDKQLYIFLKLHQTQSMPFDYTPYVIGSLDCLGAWNPSKSPAIMAYMTRGVVNGREVDIIDLDLYPDAMEDSPPLSPPLIPMESENLLKRQCECEHDDNTTTKKTKVDENETKLQDFDAWKSKAKEATKK